MDRSDLTFEQFNEIHGMQQEILNKILSACGTECDNGEYEMRIDDFMSNVVSIASCMLVDACHKVHPEDSESFEELLHAVLNTMPDAALNFIEEMNAEVH